MAPAAGAIADPPSSCCPRRSGSRAVSAAIWRIPCSCSVGKHLRKLTGDIFPWRVTGKLTYRLHRAVSLRPPLPHGFHNQTGRHSPAVH